MKLRHLYALVVVSVIGLLLVLILSVQAASMTIAAFNGASGNCSTTFTTNTDFNYAGTTNDGGGNDYVSFVVFDGNNTAFAYVAFSVPAAGGGTSFGFVLGYTVSVPAASRPFTLRVFDNTAPAASIAAAQTGAVLDTVAFDPATYGACSTLPLNTPPPSATPVTTNPAAAPAAGQMVFTDGRINNLDAAAPVAVYGIDRDGGRGLILYAIDADSHGHPVLLVEPGQIAAAPDCPAHNTLIADNAALGIAVYRLTSCQFQINAPNGDGKLYTMIFSAPYANIGYASFTTP